MSDPLTVILWAVAAFVVVASACLIVVLLANTVRQVIGQSSRTEYPTTPCGPDHIDGAELRRIMHDYSITERRLERDPGHKPALPSVVYETVRDKVTAMIERNYRDSEEHLLEE